MSILDPTPTGSPYQHERYKAATAMHTMANAPYAKARYQEEP